MRLDARTVRALTLTAWGALFLWLWVSGESVRYLGPRTQWVVPLGAIGLGLAAVGYARATREGASPRVGTPELLGLIGLVLPILAAATLADAQLGSLAASNKLSARGVDPSALAKLAAKDASEIGFLQLNAAGRDAQLAGELGLADGKPVHLVGFVTGAPKGPRRRFELSRFYITCCVADAVPIGVQVEAGPTHGRLRKDDWLDVTGPLVRERDAWVVRAARLRHVGAPSDPYLSFTS
jgi:putative membrane protein